MRNLKRVLSLALATAMLFGMMVMGASAADIPTYSDQNDIKNKEAVAVMSAIGVFQGADGKFNPTGALTRESAAKIITYMVMGKEAADDLSTSGAPFTDVAADRWSAGSIAYCSAQGIISGDGAGHFYPELTVNGYAFAKMLLGALGYNADTERLVGTGWESNVSKLVNKLNLKKGISSALSKDMTRDDAVQMAFNAGNAKTVTYEGGATIGDVIIGGTKEYSTNSFLVDTYSNLKKVPGSSDVAGRPGTEWKLGTKSLGKFGSTADYTFTAETDEDDLGLGDYTIADAGLTPKANTDETLVKVKTAADIAKLTENGRVVEVYTSDEAIETIVVIDTYLYTVGTISTAGKSVSLKTTTGAPAVSAVTKEDNEDLYNALVAMGKDAKVLVTIDYKDKNVMTVAEPETLTGKYTAQNSSGERTIDGEKYKDSYTASAAVEAAMANTNTSYTVTLDTYGYIIGAEEEAGAEAKYALVTSTDVTGSPSSGKTYLANLVYAEDGTQEWVEVAKYNNGTVNQAPDKFGDGKISDWNAALPAGTVVSYSMKADGTYLMETLKKGSLDGSGNIGNKAPEDDTFYGFTNLDITKGDAKFFSTTTGDVKTAKDILGSSKTIFVVEKNDSYTVYTGVKNVPNLTKASGTVMVAGGAKTASMVFVTDAAPTADSTSLVYITKWTGNVYNDDVEDNVYTFEAIVKGEVTTLILTDPTVADKKLSGLYKAEFDSNGYAMNLTANPTDDALRVGTSAKLDNGTITLVGTDAGAYVTADEFEVFVVDKNNKPAAISADDVNYYADSKEKLAGAYVMLDSDEQFATTLIIVVTPAS